MLDLSRDETLQKQLSHLFKKKGLEKVKLYFATSPSTHFVTVGLSVPPRRFASLRNAIQKIVMERFNGCSDVTLDIVVTNGPEDYSFRLESLEDLALPEREVVLKGEWTLGKVRSWITSNAPEEVEVLAVDTIDVKGGGKKGKRTSRNHILLRLGTAVRNGERSASSHKGQMLRADLNEFAMRFREEVGVPLLVEWLPITESARDFLQSRLSKSVVTEEDIPRLKELLAVDLRWRTLARLDPEVDMTDGNWFRIDDEKTLKPEDLFRLERSPNGLIVHIAFPDKTGRSSNCNGHSIEEAEPMSPSREPGYFVANKPRLAWIVDFIVRDGEIMPRADPEERARPYRGLVACRKEYTPRSHIAQVEPGYEELREALGVKSNSMVVARLMDLASRAVGDFFERNGDPFLMWKKPRLGKKKGDYGILKSLCEELSLAGVKAGPSDFNSPMQIARLMQRALEAGALESLSGLATALRGDPVVCMNESGRCSLKPERGVLEQINQWLLAARVDNKLEARPFFRNSESQMMFSPTEISNYLKQWEIDRHIAQFLQMLIKNLEYQGSQLDVRVKHSSGGEILCESPKLKRWGFISSSRRIRPGTRLKVRLGPFHLDKGRYEFLLGEEIQDLPEPAWSDGLALPGIWKVE